MTTSVEQARLIVEEVADEASLFREQGLICTQASHIGPLSL